jgi:DNA-binding PucR family transcriptional regulator
MKYRINKIIEETQLDLKNAEISLWLRLSFLAMDLINNDYALK